MSNTRSHHRRSQGRKRRSGVSAIETAITLPVLLMFACGLLDFGLGVFKQQVLTNAARELARQATVHGSMANRKGVWGPTAITTTADSTSDGTEGEIAEIARRHLYGFRPEDVIVEVSWPEGNNNPEEDHVLVKMTSIRQSLTMIALGSDFNVLRAVSHMEIVH